MISSEKMSGVKPRKILKRVYFVRHGESEGNVGDTQQGPETPLTDIGRRQADEIAKRIARIDFDLLVSSTYARARETAEKISAATGKPVVPSDLFIERVKPSALRGRLKKENEAEERAFYEAWLRGEKYQDAESFAEISLRAKQALAFLDSLPEERIVVVTHGMILRVIAAVVILGDLLTLPACDRFMWFLKTKNTGISEIEKRVDGNWHLVTWNDVAHLG